MGQIQYSEKHFDDTYEYRHVVPPPEVAKLVPKNRLLSETEWRAIGVQQSRGWVSLCNSPTRTTHHALQKDSELSAAAAEKPGSVKTCLPDEEPLL